LGQAKASPSCSRTTGAARKSKLLGCLLVTSPSAQDPIVAFNEVLSEVIDLIQDVKQAHRKVSETHELHAELDELFDGLRGWAQALIEEDEALGASPLSRMPSVAGRQPPNLWPTGATDEEVRRFVVNQMRRLSTHLAVALAEQNDDGSRAVLLRVEQELSGHIQLLEEP
jgi:DNA-binding ferritin-like protein